jgi:PAS domain S-box-containing protein
VRDITERKRVELALLESEELFSRAFRSSPIGITITNQNNGKFIEVNKAWCNIYGFTIEEAIGHTAEELAIIDSETRHRIINEIKAKGTLTSIELSLRDKRGNYHTILFSSENIEIAGEPCVLSTGIDITDRKLAEKALKENNSRLELAMQSANMAWWEMDIITGSVIFDQRKSEMLGYPAEKFKHYKDFMSLVHHEDSDKAMKAMQRHIDGLTDKYEIEYRILTRSGEYKWFYDIGAIVKNDPKGLPLLATGLVIDISERKQAEEKIKMLNEELEERVIQRTTQLEDANKELEAFSYSVSHDLRSPLRHINGFAEILTKQYSDNLPEDAKKYLNTITGSAKKMGILIDDLLSFSRTGRAELKKATLKMNQVIEDSIAQIQPSLKDRKIDWKISPLPEVNGDYNLLRLAWINLLDNAVKYTRYKEKAVIQIGFKDEIGNIIFYIQDNGVGFDMKYADKLFGVFQRLHSSSQFDGTGIGLANVQRIIFRHGGRTWAEAETDKGATFYFSIPKEKEDKR